MAAPYAEAQISGTINNDTTWSASSVTISDTVTVAEGATLTIDPSVEVRFQDSTGLIIKGGLIADGEKASTRIVFTSDASSPSPGDWNSIVFVNKSDVGSYVNYATIEYGGGGEKESNIFYDTGAFGVPFSNTIIRHSKGHGMDLRASDPKLDSLNVRNNNGYGLFSDVFSNFTVTNSEIVNNATGGIRVAVNAEPVIKSNRIDSNDTGILMDSDAAPTITNNKIRHGKIGIHVIEVGSVQPDIQDNRIAANSQYGMLNDTPTGTVVNAEFNYWGHDSGPFHPSTNINGQGNEVSDFVDFDPWITETTLSVTEITGDINQDTTWKNGVFWIKNSIRINSGNTLTIKPGVIVKFASLAKLEARGVLHAEGTKNSKIIFTSDKDDSYGGDTNQDGTSSTPSPGDWNRIEIRNSNTVLEHATIKYGASDWQGAINVNINGSLTLSNLFMTRGARNAIRIDNGNAFHADSMHISHHHQGIRNRENSLTLTVTHSIIEDHSNDGINSDGPIRKLAHSVLRDNGNSGMVNTGVEGPQMIKNNVFKNNGHHGFYVKNNDTTITIKNNRFEGNNREGFVTSQAKILNNTIRSNRYPFGVHGKLDYTYTNDQGNDNNVIENNRFNNALKISGNIRDTLSNNVPADMDTSVYVAHDDFDIQRNWSLTIDPGVIMKFKNRRTDMDVYGKLKAVGTSQEPIVFTSWIDTVYGGRTHGTASNKSPSNHDWNNLRIRDDADAATQLKNVIIRYGDESLVVNKSLNKALEHIRIEFGTWGFNQHGNAVNTLTNSMINSNRRTGIRVRSGELTVRNTTVKGNGYHGLLAWGRNNAAFREVTNSIIKNNNREGIRVNHATIPQTFKGNIIKGNGGHGIFNRNSGAKRGDIQFIGNLIKNNNADGIVSSSARFIDNEIIGNRYPFGLTGQLGNSYEDSDGKDGNIIRNNTFNNIIRIKGAVRGTLETQVPDSMDFRHFFANHGMEVNRNDTLFIDSTVVLKVADSDLRVRDKSHIRFAPGAIVKLKGGGTRLEVHGKVTAVGTETNPVIFTSWRDTTYGGRTHDPNSDKTASAHDWNAIRIQGNANPNTRLENILVRYGDENIIMKQGLNHPIDSIISEKGKQGFDQQRNVINTITNSTFRDNNRDGIKARDGDIILRNITSKNNGRQGVDAFSRRNAVFSEIRNSTIRGNQRQGILIRGASTPVSIVHNKIDSNKASGVFVRTFNKKTDSLLIISGNDISHNGHVGLISTRAMITDNTFEGNKFPIGVTRRLSLEGSSTEDGNFYNNNTIKNNQFDNAIWIQGPIYGKLGYSYPESMNSPVYASLNSRYRIPSGNTLDVAQGTVIKMLNNRFRIRGTLRANGDADSKIVFTSWKDDSFGGDSNEDSTETVPSPSDWRGIRFQDGSKESFLNNVAVRYGRHNIRIRNNNDGMIIDSTSSSFAKYNGFFIKKGNPVITSAEIHHNHKGIRVRRSAAPQIRLSNIFKNDKYGLHSSSSNTVTATDNFWGHKSGPLVKDDRDPNLSGEGNGIRMDDGFVEYRPFLKDRSGILLGDVSTTGSITAFDAAMVLQYLVDKRNLSSTQKRSANVDGDTTITAMDASFILQYVVDLITAFPGQGKPVPDEKIAEGIQFKTESGDNWQDLIIKYNGEVSPYATELSLSFKSPLVDSIAWKKPALTQDFNRVENREDGKYKLAMANSKPAKGTGTLIHLRIFLTRDIDKIDQKLFNLERFGFNQYDLTKHFEELVTSIASRMTDIPDKFKLENNYPNPFNPTTKIPYQIPVKSEVEIVLYDALGRHVATLVDKKKEPGRHTVKWNARDRASGVYLYRISAEGPDGKHFQDIRKMMLVK